jgi:hypothetical protein
MIIFNLCCKKLRSEASHRSASCSAHGHASLENLKLIRSFDWIFLTRLECNRHINPDKTGNRPVKEIYISEKGDVVHLKGYGMIKVFKNVRTYDDFEYWATNDLAMNDLMRLKYAEISWMIETCSSRHQTILRN